MDGDPFSCVCMCMDDGKDGWIGDDLDRYYATT